MEEWNVFAFGNTLNVRAFLSFIEFLTGIIIFQESDHDTTHAAFYKLSSCYIMLTEGVWVNLSPVIQ